MKGLLVQLKKGFQKIEYLFQGFLATEVSKQLAEGADPQSVRLDFNMSKMKLTLLSVVLCGHQKTKIIGQTKLETQVDSIAPTTNE